MIMGVLQFMMSQVAANNPTSRRRLRQAAVPPLIVVAVLFTTACAGGGTDPVQTGLQSSPADAQLLVQVRSGESGSDRTWLKVHSGADVVTAVGLEGVAAEAAEAAFMSQVESSSTASEAAFDILAQTSVKLWQSGRKWHVVVPNGPGDLAVIMSPSGHCEGLFRMPDGRPVPVPPAAVKRIRDIAVWDSSGKRVAVRATPEDGNPYRHHVLIVDGSSGAVAKDISLPRIVEDIAWRPDGQGIALLCSDERMGDALLERMAHAVGHGKPYDDLYVVLVELASGRTVEGRIASDLPYGTGRLLWDTRGIRSVSH
jgi:hypothetical protein